MESDSKSLCNCEARESRGSSEGKRTRQPRDPRCNQRRGFRMMDRWVSAVQRSHSHFIKHFRARASITRPCIAKTHKRASHSAHTERVALFLSSLSLGSSLCLEDTLQHKLKTYKLCAASSSRPRIGGKGNGKRRRKQQASAAGRREPGAIKQQARS